MEEAIDTDVVQTDIASPAVLPLDDITRRRQKIMP